jgi:glycerol kinase
MSVVLSLDQGTTSSRAIVFDHSGKILATARRELSQHYPQPGWVEHDANEIWSGQIAVAQEALQQARLSAADVAAIGITNQRETTVIWDRQTGQPIYHAIVWQDRRTADLCQALRAAGHTERVQQKTGLLIDPYFCATKIAWLLDNVPLAREKAERGELAFGTIDSWLIWNLSGGQVHATDVTNASRTMLFNIATMQWDEDLLALLRIPRSLLPAVLPSSSHFCDAAPGLLGRTIPVCGAAGDQQAALYGQNCTHHGMAKNTYGTGCFMLLNIGSPLRHSENQLLTTVACGAKPGTHYALEGSVFVAGAIVQWLRDGLGIIKSSHEIESLAASVVDSDGVYLVPALAGLGAPYWDAYARGILVGITRGTQRAHIARAALEGIAFQVADVLDAMKKDAQIPIGELRVDGGACANNLLMQFQADILRVPVVRPEIIETTALGAAYLAGLAVGFWKNEDEIARVWKSERVFEPCMSLDEVEHRRKRWSDAIARSRDWEHPA